jgi:hypothetical protein
MSRARRNRSAVEEHQPPLLSYRGGTEYVATVRPYRTVDAPRPISTTLARRVPTCHLTVNKGHPPSRFHDPVLVKQGYIAWVRVSFSSAVTRSSAGLLRKGTYSRPADTSTIPTSRYPREQHSPPFVDTESSSLPCRSNSVGGALHSGIDNANVNTTINTTKN